MKLQQAIHHVVYSSNPKIAPDGVTQIRWNAMLKMIQNQISVVECQEISDICAKNLIKYKYKTYHGDFNDIKFNRSYDLVTCWHVLEHIKDLYSFVKKCSKITNKYLVIEVPTNRNLKDPNKGDWDGHYHYFSKESMRYLFKEKFEIIKTITPGIQSPALLVFLKKLNK